MLLGFYRNLATGASFNIRSPTTGPQFAFRDTVWSAWARRRER